MANVTFILSKRTGANGKSEIIVRYPVSRTKYYQLKTSVYVLPENFMVEGVTGGNRFGRIVVPKRGKLNFVAVLDAEQAQRELTEYVNRLLRICSVFGVEAFGGKEDIQAAIQGTKHIPADNISARDVGEALAKQKQHNEEKKTLWEYGEAFILSHNYSDGQTKQFKVLFRDMHRWEAWRQYTGEKFTLDIHSITANDIEAFRTYISTESELQEAHPKAFAAIIEKYPLGFSPKHKAVTIGKRGTNTLHKKMKEFKNFWNWLNEKHYTENKPFEGIKIDAERYGVPYYLTIEERNHIAEFDLSARPALAVQRDIFVFHCLIGCRVGDLLKLTSANITNGVLEYVPHKTKDEAHQVKPRIPLNTRALALIEKYKGVDAKGRLFPYISPQKYNNAIKDVLRACGISRNVIIRNALTGENESVPICNVASSHMARRTFVGAAYSKVQDPNIVGRMGGHVEGSRAFARYRTITDDVLQGVISQIDTEPVPEDHAKAELLKQLAALSAEELAALLKQ